MVMEISSYCWDGGLRLLSCFFCQYLISGDSAFTRSLIALHSGSRPDALVELINYVTRNTGGN